MVAPMMDRPTALETQDAQLQMLYLSNSWQYFLRIMIITCDSPPVKEEFPIERFFIPIPRIPVTPWGCTVYNFCVRWLKFYHCDEEVVGSTNANMVGHAIYKSLQM